MRAHFMGTAAHFMGTAAAVPSGFRAPSIRSRALLTFMCSFKPSTCKNLIIVPLGSGAPLAAHTGALLASSLQVLGGLHSMRGGGSGGGGGEVVAPDAVRQQFRRSSMGAAGGADGGDADGTGQRPVEGDCPVCFDEMEAGGEGASSTFSLPGIDAGCTLARCSHPACCLSAPPRPSSATCHLPQPYLSLLSVPAASNPHRPSLSRLPPHSRCSAGQRRGSQLVPGLRQQHPPQLHAGKQSQLECGKGVLHGSAG